MFRGIEVQRQKRPVCRKGLQERAAGKGCHRHCSDHNQSFNPHLCCCWAPTVGILGPPRGALVCGHTKHLNHSTHVVRRRIQLGLLEVTGSIMIIGCPKGVKISAPLRGPPSCFQSDRDESEYSTE